MMKDGYRYNGTQKYRCAQKTKDRITAKRLNPEYRERENARRREWYHQMSGFKYNEKLLRGRRYKALIRMRERNKRSAGGE